MSRYKETFPNPHTVLPVIHVESLPQAFVNIAIAREEEADGVFLIDMRQRHPSYISQIHKMARQEFGTWWIGINYLNVPTIKAFTTAPRETSGIWADDGGIDEWADEQVNAIKIDAARKQSTFDGLYFGGVAFKYQDQVSNVALAARIAKEFMDVVTTSGEGTGIAADPEKIFLMKQAIGDHPLGIASGITPDNVHNYKNAADCFLVATSITGKDEIFDRVKIRDLIQAVRG